MINHLECQPFPSIPFQLLPNEVQIWFGTTELSETAMRKMVGIINTEEYLHSARLRFPHDQMYYIASHGLLRILLGSYLQIPSNIIQFKTNSYGKPYLANQDGNNTLYFNMSHSNCHVIYAFTTNREVGIDIEYIHSGRANLQIAKQFFSASEFESLQTTPEEIKLESFYSCWTRKEAYIKARGMGLSLALDSFAVSISPGEQEVKLSIPEQPDEALPWTIYALHPHPDYVAAIAVEEKECQFTSYYIPNWFY